MLAKRNMLRQLRAVIPRALRARARPERRKIDESDADEREPTPAPSPIDELAAPHWLGSRDPTLLIAGHSHLFAFYQYFERSGQTAPVAVLSQRDPVPAETTGSSTVDSDPYWTVALSSARDRALPLAIVWGGNHHNSFFLLESDERFSVFPATGPWEDGHPRALVPRSLLREFFALQLAGLRSVLSKAASITVLLLGTPPPKADDQIRAGFDREPLFAAAASERGMTAATLPITPLPVRVELWRITQELLREIADEFGAMFVAVPERAFSGAGLRADLSYADATHANGLWGEIMVDAARKALART